MARTMNDRSRIADAGVETGAKMFGVWTGVMSSPRCPRGRVRWQMTCRADDGARSLQKWWISKATDVGDEAAESAANAGVLPGERQRWRPFRLPRHQTGRAPA